MENIEEINTLLSFVLQIVAIIAVVSLIGLIIFIYRIIKNTKEEIEFQKQEIQDQISDKLNYVENIRFIKPGVNYAVIIYSLNTLMKLLNRVSRSIDHLKR
jgi:hypothetical protein